MSRLFAAADAGELGPLLELAREAWGKDPFLGGPIGDRLTQSSAVDLQILANPQDPDQGRAMALAAYVEEMIPALASYRYEPAGGAAATGYARGYRAGPYRADVAAPAGPASAVDQVAVWEGGISHVIEALAISWYYGLGNYWIPWDRLPGEPRPRPVGVSLIDPRRYRVDEWGRLSIETVENPSGLALRSLDPLCWLSVSASRAGMPAALAGVGRGLMFWWWLKISGAQDLARYLEKFALPNVVGERADVLAGAFNQNEDDELAKFLDAYMNDVAALFPKGFKVEILSAPPGGQGVFETIERVCRSAILYGILGNETTTSSAGGAAASSPGIAGGGASEGARVQRELVLGDRRRVGEGLQEIGRRGIYVEFGAEHATYPPLVQLLDASAAGAGARGEAGAPGAVSRPSAAPAQDGAPVAAPQGAA